MSIEKIMSKTVVTVGLDEPLRLVKEIFDQAHFHHLIVIESGCLFGVVSDRDLLKALSPKVGTVDETLKDAACLNKKVHQIMSRDPVSIKQDAGIHEAIDLFNQHNNISCLPVVDNANKPVGIVSWRDILRELADQRNALS